MRTMLALFVAFAALSVAACNSVVGMGQDASAAGQAVSQTANGAK